MIIAWVIYIQCALVEIVTCKYPIVTGANDDDLYNVNSLTSLAGS